MVSRGQLKARAKEKPLGIIKKNTSFENDYKKNESKYIYFRDVAQSGSALHWGCSGRRFKSGHPDQIYKN